MLGFQRGDLIDKVDCAVNVHAEGCHLLCHDDVIGTRRVSFIVYLTDEGWESSDGGNLELYGSSVGTCSDGAARREPLPSPSATVPPTFNTMAMFSVLPNVSYHSVEEVRGSRPRMSVQGWYHGRGNVEKEEEGTLGRLKEKGRDNLGEVRRGRGEDKEKIGMVATTSSPGQRRGIVFVSSLLTPVKGLSFRCFAFVSSLLT